MTRILLSLPFAHKAAVMSSALCLIACGILLIANHQSQQQLVRKSAEHFSQSLAHQIATEASAPLVQGDKLGLQTLLDNLVRDSLVSHAVIYGVDHRPLVEAGIPQRELLAQSASISFQDSLAGYVVISLNPYSLTQMVKRNTWSLLGLTFLLAAAVYMATVIIIRPVSRFLDQMRQGMNNPADLPTTPYDSDDELCQLHEAVSSKPKTHSSKNTPEQTLLHIEINNLDTLNQAEPVLDKLVQQLDTLCRLYEGQCEATRSNAFTASFAPTQQDANNHPFRALCCAYLLNQLHDEDSELELAISLTVSQQQDSCLDSTLSRQQLLDELSQSGRQQLASVNANASVYQHPAVEGRVEINSGTLVAFAESYQHLLSNQLAMLKKQM